LNLISEYDIAFLSETWISENTFLNLNVNDYCCEHILGNKSYNTRKDRYSGGISVYYRNHLRKYVTIVEKNQYGVMWIKLSKELFSFNEDVYVCNIYIPPINSKVIPNDQFDFFEELETGIEKYASLGKLFLTGDLNSRCSDKNDLLSFDPYIDVDNQLSDHVIVLPRASMDHVIDTHGNRLIELCLSTSHIIGNGWLHSDQGVGDYTFHSLNGSSVVDYLLLKPYKFKYINSFKILQPNEFSDHSGISFSITCKNNSSNNNNNNNNNNNTNNNATTTTTTTTTTTNNNNNNNNTSNSDNNNNNNITYDNINIRWEPDKEDELNRMFAAHIDHLSTLTEKINSDHDINEITESFISIMQNASSCMTKVNKTKVNSSYSNPNKKPWFNSDCFNARLLFKKARNKYTKNKSDAELRNDFFARKIKLQ